jgi:hypothetical protein
MLPGIKEGQQKMSKSDPASAIFMEDDEVFSSLYIGVFLIYHQSLLVSAS